MPPDLSLETVISPCGTWRYLLHRSLNVHSGERRFCNFVMLNPSTADAVQDDPTIRRCIGFARAWGYSSLMVTNLFALRATNPRELSQHPDPAGPENDAWLLRAAQMADLVVLAWGNHGDVAQRNRLTWELLERGRQRKGAPLHCLGITQQGAPKHPLYLPRNTAVRPWQPATIAG